MARPEGFEPLPPQFEAIYPTQRSTKPKMSAFGQKAYAEKTKKLQLIAMTVLRTLYFAQNHSFY